MYGVTLSVHVWTVGVRFPVARGGSALGVEFPTQRQRAHFRPRRLPFFAPPGITPGPAERSMPHALRRRVRVRLNFLELF